MHGQAAAGPLTMSGPPDVAVVNAGPEGQAGLSAFSYQATSQ